MFKMEQMKALVEERLTAAVGDVLGIIENVIKDYVEKESRSKSEIERQNRLDIRMKPKIKQRADPPQISVWKEEVPPEQQERSPSPDQEDPEPPLIKEEEEETWTSQEEEQLQGLEEADTKDSIYTVTCLGSLHDQHQSQFPHQTVENREGEPLPGTSTEHMRTEPDREGCGYSEQTSDCQPISSDCSVAEIEDTDRDDEDRPGSGGAHSGLKTKTSKSSGISSKGKTSMELSQLKSSSKDSTNCKVCGKWFSRSADLKEHIMTHTGEKPYSCSFCGRRFRRHQHIQRHVKIHTGEKPYTCSVCGKGFSRRYGVQMHMKTHTGERPYSCSVCGKGFIQSSDLKKHMWTHTGERPYRCIVCGKGFSRRDSAQDHMKTHTGEKPQSGNVC